MRNKLITAVVAVGALFAPAVPCHVFAGESVYVSQIGDIARGQGGSSAGLSQAGDRNQAHIEQDSPGQVGFIGQVGNDNIANLTQTGGESGNVAVIFQGGSINTATVEQTAYTSGSTAIITQTGDGNHVNLAQTGDDNQAALTQIGNNNQMDVTQTGNKTLVWTQIGSNLPSIDIAGSQNLVINQIGMK